MGVGGAGLSTPGCPPGSTGVGTPVLRILEGLGSVGGTRLLALYPSVPLSI